MITIEQLEKFYENELKDSIAGLSGIRKKMHKLLYLAIFVAVCTILLLFIVNPKWLKVLLTIACILGASYLLILAQAEYVKLIPHYKNQIVKRLIELINPEFTYSQNGHIDIKEFNSSSLFKTQAAKCTGDDMITGAIGKTSFKFSEFQAIERKVNDKGEEYFPTFFHGLFFYAEFNKHITGKTFVLPDKHKEVTNLIGQEKRQTDFYGDLVKLENPMFEKIFSVYGSSQQESRYVITPAMMEAIVNIYNKYKREMYFSFNGDHVYCAIRFSKNNGIIKGIFEPSGKKTSTDLNEVKEVYHLLKLIDTIINELNLNTRIWTKE